MPPTPLSKQAWDKLTVPQQHMYALVNPPSSLSMMQPALENYYPAHISEKLISAYNSVEQDAGKLFGMITSDMQARAPIRALCKTLVDAGVPLSHIFRYRSGFRAKCMDSLYSPDLGVVSVELQAEDNESTNPKFTAVTNYWTSVDSCS
jgi:hypothetical protein